MTQTVMARRWPPIVAAIIGAVLVFLVLPNPLSVPQTNPSASAEYAPVPGKQEEAQSANFSQTNTASSSGIGSGGEGIGALPGIPQPKLPEFKPRQKNCVGNPPRQTEDPLSPPCVPFFEGKNGGATFPGVTKDEIAVVLYNDRCCEGELNSPWRPSDESQCFSMYPEECDYTIRTVKAHLRFFQRRFQTYGRTVRLFASRSTGSVGGACSTRQSDARGQIQEYNPFAVVSFSQGAQNCYFKEMAKARVPVFGINEDAEQGLYESNRPYAFGFLPSQEAQVAWSASFICRKLLGETAKHAGDATYHGEMRKIGFIRPRDESRGPELMSQAELLVEQLDAQCGYTFDAERYFEGARAAGSREASGIMSSFKRDGITTVVCYCIPRQYELTAPTMLRAASAIGYLPEWYWDAASQMERGIWQREYGSAEQKSMGTTYLWRAPALREQFHWQAYLQEEPGTRPAVYWNLRIYSLFLNLFSAIQAAGPDLTPDSVEQGMFTFNYVQPQNPWVPTGGYGPYNPKATSDYTFIDTAMAVWWDPSGSAPGDAGEGCMRVVRQGLRFFAGEWPEGDKDMFRSDDPCTADLYKDVDPGF